jgi:threonine-phosphate decarboxylase
MIQEISNVLQTSGQGENIYRLAEEFKIQERKVIDFSTPVNPLGVSKKVKAEIRKHVKYLHNYPDPEVKRLRRRLAQFHGVNPDTIVCGNGSTELIYLIIRALKPQEILIPAPTFSEYERAVIQQSAFSFQQSEEKEQPITYLMLNKEKGFEIIPDEFIRAMRGDKNSSLNFDMAFLCNPNNPTGRLLIREDVKRIADIAREIKCYLIVDEAFIDFSPDESVIKDVKDNPYLIVLRTMTNFYALSGLRIGYGVLSQNLIGRLKRYKEPFTVNSLAQRAAVTAIKDKVYRAETFRLINEEKRFLEKGFKKMGIEFFPSNANFYLLKINSAPEIYHHLKKEGILVRDCSNFRGLDNTYLRVTVKSHKENTILIKKLTSILQSLD